MGWRYRCSARKAGRTDFLVLVLQSKGKKAQMLNVLLLGDEKVSFIRSFHSSTLWVIEYSLNAERFTFPLVPAEPKKAWQVWATKWCAERKVRVGAMRDEYDLPLDVWSWCFPSPFQWIMETAYLLCFLHRVMQHVVNPISMFLCIRSTTLNLH